MPDSTDAAPRPARTIPPKPAASLILLREGAEILMGMRGAGHRFMPNRLVFPGGRVDRADLRAPAATPLAPHVEARLRRSASPALAHGLAIAVARELAEETGLSLGAPPALDRLDYLCRAVTPPGLPIRFNARFFVTDAAHARGTLAGSGELEGLRFYPIAEALALDLALATRFVLENLKLWLALSPEQRASRTTTPLLRFRRGFTE
jgi:8-oxo-dGTP pyrophosphatase MutT (NUDIX family)